MRSSTLIALLPLLAHPALSHAARPRSVAEGGDESIVIDTKQDNVDEGAFNRYTQKRISRRSINFGPTHRHATFVTLPRGPIADADVEAADVLQAQAAWEVKEVVGDLIDRLNVIEPTGEEPESRAVVKKGVEGRDWYIRKDTYTDPRTGITHVYVKQLVDGLEVVDGDMNVNIDEHGQVLSYGDSFFRGDTRDMFIGIRDRLDRPFASAADSHECKDLGSKVQAIEAELNKLQAGIVRLGDLGLEYVAKKEAEVVKEGISGMVQSAVDLIRGYLLGSFSTSASTIKERLGEIEAECDEIMRGLKEEHGVFDLDALWNRWDLVRAHFEHLGDHAGVVCAEPVRNTVTPEGEAEPITVEHGPVEAVLQLLKHLSPDAGLLPTDQEIRAEVELTEEEDHSAFAPPDRGVPTFVIKGLPGAETGGVVAPVGVRMAYHQTSDGEMTLVWRCVLEMKDNWYEASVDALTLKVVSVVDWASDAPPSAKRNRKGGKQKPLPVPHRGKPYTYTVFPFGVNDPSVGNLSSVHAPWDPIASPAGWHAIPDASNPYAKQSIPGMKTGLKGPWVEGYTPVEGEFDGKYRNGTWSSFGTTMGNNVFSQEDWEGASNWLRNERPVNSSYIFDYEYGEPDGLRPKEYIDLAVTQLFYTSNMYHDLLYRLGFDELSGNFQMDNFGKGGLGGDGVICQAQDGSGTDNANFMTPPDGQQPRMRMYVWDTATPYRDGDLEAGIVIHEYSHGLSTRLTGGPANSRCLGFGEAGGMGEGWGDAFATLIRQTTEYGTHEEEYGMGSWAANRKAGIRNYVYSANMTSNPSTFKTLDKPGYWGVHAIGEVWAEMLFVVEQRLIAKHGFSKTLFPPVNATAPNDYYLPINATVSALGKPSSRPSLVPRHGNTLLAHLLVEGMKLQPCNPTFVAARDAIIQADLELTGGNNTCDIWRGFAERGLGVEAKTLGQLPWGGGVRSEDFTLPKICGTKPKH